MPLKRTAAVRVLTLVILGGSSAACDDGPLGVPPEGSIDLATPWVRATPESVGLDENALFTAGEIGSRIDRMRSLVVVREGRLAYDRYYHGWTVDTLADVRSVTKSVLATLVGIAVADGAIDRSGPRRGRHDGVAGRPSGHRQPSAPRGGSRSHRE